MKFKTIFFGLLALLFIIFVFQNVDTVDIRFLFWTAYIPRSIFIIVLICIGMGLGWYLRSLLYNRAKRSSSSNTVEKETPTP